MIYYGESMAIILDILFVELPLIDRPGHWGLYDD